MSSSIPIFMFLLSFIVLCSSQKACNVGEKYLHDSNFYARSCPKAQVIVKSIVANATKNETRVPAFLLRLHFHDCFVQGCDASILLDSTQSLTSEKGSNPNINSARGFEVIDEIKEALEKACPSTVSCADIMAIAARDSTVLTGGLSWEVRLGRKDSKTASISKSNNGIPAPNNTFNTILNKFKNQGLDVTDLVALSGSHTIGKARCTSFRQRLYSQSSSSSLDKVYAAQLAKTCPRSGGDQRVFPLDPTSPRVFDNSYFKVLLKKKGLLSSDQVLLTDNKESAKLVKSYAEDSNLFLNQFAKSMVKMGNIIDRTTFSNGEIRTNCRKINSN